MGLITLALRAGTALQVARTLNGIRKGKVPKDPKSLIKAFAPLVLTQLTKKK